MQSRKDGATDLLGRERPPGDQVLSGGLGRLRMVAEDPPAPRSDGIGPPPEESTPGRALGAGLATRDLDQLDETPESLVFGGVFE